MPLPPREQIEQAAAAHGWTVTESDATRLELRWRGRPGARCHMLVEFGAAGQLVGGQVGGPGGIPLPGLYHDTVLAAVLHHLQRVADTGRREAAEKAATSNECSTSRNRTGVVPRL